MHAFELLVKAHRPAMKAVLAKLVDLLHAHNVRPRMTVDVDAFVDVERKDEVDKLLASNFELVKAGRFDSRIWLSQTGATPSFLERSSGRPRPKRFFGSISCPRNG
jgi:hypothetical protein